MYFTHYGRVLISLYPPVKCWALLTVAMIPNQMTWFSHWPQISWCCMKASFCGQSSFRDLRCLATYALAIFVFSSSSLKVPENCFNRPWHWIWPQVSLQKVPHKSINTIKLMIILSKETTDFLFSLCPHTDLCLFFLWPSLLKATERNNRHALSLPTAKWLPFQYSNCNNFTSSGQYFQCFQVKQTKYQEEILLPIGRQPRDPHDFHSTASYLSLCHWLWSKL